MATRRLNKDGDFTFGKSKQDYLYKSDEIKQNLTTRLKEFQNDWILDIEKGIDYFTILQSKNNEKVLINEINRVSGETAGVRTVLDVKILKKENRILQIEVSYEDIYNKQLLANVGVDI